ncbi:MAG: hypothetical protein RRB13_10595 [bacterium]|nr:hypothetical protein [bacterium]
MEPNRNVYTKGTEILQEDQELFESIVNQRLSPEQEALITQPPAVYPKDDAVLAVHWHPEYVPMPLIKQRIEATFPNAKEHLIIPTQHNQILVYDDYAGVEVDCYSPEFNTKVQLLLHFAPEKVAEASVLKSMLMHTFNYRATQLFDFLHCLTRPEQDFILQKAAAKTGANIELVNLVRLMARKLGLLIEQNEAILPKEAIKNKLIRNFFDGLRGTVGDATIDRAQHFLREVKKAVKKDFDLTYFYKTQEIIEETRGLGGGIVIPHPEQFWPILMADYDVDGIEVWNPQSSTYTEFLINVVNRQNRSVAPGRRPLLVFMGDDTHLGEKLKAPGAQSAEKVIREVGVQPPWDDLSLKKTLIQAQAEKHLVIAEYKARLNS